MQGRVYFSTGAIVSLRYVTDRGAPAELAVVGHHVIVRVAVAPLTSG